MYWAEAFKVWEEEENLFERVLNMRHPGILGLIIVKKSDCRQPISLRNHPYGPAGAAGMEGTCNCYGADGAFCNACHCHTMRRSNAFTGNPAVDD